MEQEQTIDSGIPKAYTTLILQGLSYVQKYSEEHNFDFVKEILKGVRRNYPGVDIEQVKLNIATALETARQNGFISQSDQESLRTVFRFNVTPTMETQSSQNQAETLGLGQKKTGEGDATDPGKEPAKATKKGKSKSKCTCSHCTRERSLSETESTHGSSSSKRPKLMVQNSRGSGSRSSSNTADAMGVVIDAPREATRRVGMLRNGNYLRMRHGLVQIGQETVVLANTCPFDALVQLLAVAYRDSQEYCRKVDNINEDDRGILNVVLQLAGGRAGEMAYFLRALLLIPVCGDRSWQVYDGRDVLLCDCNSPVSGVVTAFMSVMPSTIETSQCSSPFCPFREQTQAFAIARINSDSLHANGIGSLESAILDGQPADKTTCLRLLPPGAEVPEEYVAKDDDPSPDHRACGGVRTRSIVAGHNMLVEIVNSEEHGTDEDSPSVGVELPLTVKLEAIPRELKIYDKELKLRGAVAFEPPVRDREKIGHYVAFARRNDDSWEVYDDQMHNVMSVSSRLAVVLHLLVYTVQ